MDETPIRRAACFHPDEVSIRVSSVQILWPMCAPFGLWPSCPASSNHNPAGYYCFDNLLWAAILRFVRRVVLMQSLGVTLVSGWLHSVVFAAEAGHETASSPVILIAPLDGNKAQVSCWSPSVSQALTEMFVESLAKAGGKFQISASPEPQPQPAKPQPGEPGSRPGGKSAADVSNDSPKTDSAAAPGSDFTLYGNVTEFGAQTNTSRVGDFVASNPFAAFGAKLVTAHVVIDWRLVDADTKMVVTRGVAAGTAHGSEFDVANLTPANDGNLPDAASPPKTAASATPVPNSKPAATVKPGSSTKNGSSNLALANNIFSGLGKALDTSAAGAGNGNNGNHNGTAGNSGAPTNALTKTPPKTSGESAPRETTPTVIGYDNSQFMASALGKATAQAVNSAVQQLTAFNLPESARQAKMRTATDALKHTPGKVLAVAGKDTIIISLGSNQSFKEGDQLNLYQTVDVKDDKGNVVYTDEKLVGELTIVSVQADRSRASYAGDLTVQQGWVVKAK